MNATLAKTACARGSGRTLGSSAAPHGGFVLVCVALATLAEPRAAFADATGSSPSVRGAPDAATPAPAPSAAALGSGSSAPTAPYEQDALGVKLSLGRSGFEPSALRAIIAQELGVPVAEATNDLAERSWLEVRLETADRATVDYCTAHGRCVGRSIELPAQRERALETIALLASNVARNEAAELIAALERRTAAALASTEPIPGATQPGPGTQATPTQAAVRQEPSAAVSASSGATGARGPLLSEDHWINLSLWYPVAVLRDSERRRLHLELGLGYSRIGAIRGMGTNALFAHVDQDVEGAVIAGLGARAGGDSKGLLTGGLGVLTQGRLRGTSLGGLVSLHLGHGSGPYGVDPWSGASLEGIQSSGLFSHAAGDVIGAQLTGGMNTLMGNLQGAQVSGGLNWVAGDVEGLQAATVNISLGSTNGLLAGAVNVAGLRGPALLSSGAELAVVNVDRASFNGAQIGVVNVSGRQHGAQIGVVNISDELDGVPIGLVNLGGNTDPSVVAFATNRTPANIGAKFVTKYTFSLLSVGYDPKGTSQASLHPVLQSAIQFGGHIPVLADGAIEPSVGYAYETYTKELDTSATGGHVVLYRAAFSWHVIPELGVFVGGGARQMVSHEGDLGHEAEGFGGLELF